MQKSYEVRTADVEVAGQSLEMASGDACFPPADQFHIFTVTSETPVKLLVICGTPYGGSLDKVSCPNGEISNGASL